MGVVELVVDVEELDGAVEPVIGEVEELEGTVEPVVGEVVDGVLVGDVDPVLGEVEGVLVGDVDPVLGEVDGSCDEWLRVVEVDSPEVVFDSPWWEVDFPAAGVESVDVSSAVAGWGWPVVSPGWLIWPELSV